MPFAAERPVATSAAWKTTDRDQAAVAFSAPADPWPDNIADRLAQLLKLSAGWDGHAAGPVNRAVVDYACSLLPRLIRPGIPPPFIAPLASGGLQIEWHRKGWDLEVEIGRPGSLYVYACELATGREWEADLTDDLSELRPMLDAIAE